MQYAEAPISLCSHWSSIHFDRIWMYAFPEAFSYSIRHKNTELRGVKTSTKGGILCRTVTLPATKVLPHKQVQDPITSIAGSPVPCRIQCLVQIPRGLAVYCVWFWVWGHEEEKHSTPNLSLSLLLENKLSPTSYLRNPLRFGSEHKLKIYVFWILIGSVKMQITDWSKGAYTCHAANATKCMIMNKNLNHFVSKYEIIASFARFSNTLGSVWEGLERSL